MRKRAPLPAFVACGRCRGGWIAVKGWKITRAVRCACWWAHERTLAELSGRKL